MDPPAKKRGRPRKNTNPTSIETEPKSSDQLELETTVRKTVDTTPKPVPKRKASKGKQKYKEISSDEEYQADITDEEVDPDEVESQQRRSTSAKRKSIAILTKDQTESWGNYRNTIDNGPVPPHALTLNEVAFDVALRLQHLRQARSLTIDYLNEKNLIEFRSDRIVTEHIQSNSYPIKIVSSNEQNPSVLKPFETIVHKDQIFTLNIGLGPVQALDWLPMPTFACPVSQQFLAVGCSCPSVHSKHFYDEKYSYKNYVQLWMFDLNVTNMTNAPQAHQLIGLMPIEDSGAIWSLKWSPALSSGSAYLAVGASSGVIYIYKIFSKLTELLKAVSKVKDAFPVYHCQKSIRCTLPEAQSRTQCLSLDWSKHDPTRLAASYSNGFIALYHVNTNVKYLMAIDNNVERTIHPIRLIRCSPTPIRDIKFLNDSANLVVIIANIAKRFCVWDFDDCHQQLIDIENSGTESVIRSLTGDLLCAKEFTPSYARTSAYLAYEPESSNLPKHIYFQSTPDHVLSIDYSPWLDASLLCDSNGHVFFFRLTNFVRWTRKNECSLKYRLKLFNMTAIPKSDKQITVSNDEVKEELTFEQSSYLDLIEKYSIDTNVSCDQKFVSKQDDFSKAGSYALNALHKIRFNPNLGSYAWCAFAGESGLLFLLPLQQAWSNHATTIYEKENKKLE